MAKKVGFPRDIVQLIAKYAAVWKFSPWVKEIDMECNNDEYRACLSRNPMAMDEINKAETSWDWIQENPADWAVDLTLENYEHIRRYNLARNRNPRAFAFFLANASKDLNLMDDYTNEMLSGNPLAIDFLKVNRGLVSNIFIMWNPAAKDLIEEMKIPIHHRALAINEADWAVDIMLQPGVIDSINNKYSLSDNKNPRMVGYLISHPELIDWDTFSGNPTAIDYLRANPSKVTNRIYANPKALEPTIRENIIPVLMDL